MIVPLVLAHHLSEGGRVVVHRLQFPSKEMTPTDRLIQYTGTGEVEFQSCGNTGHLSYSIKCGLIRELC